MKAGDPAPLLRFVERSRLAAMMSSQTSFNRSSFKSTFETFANPEQIDELYDQDPFCSKD
jgi:hypothetical protein